MYIIPDTIPRSIEPKLLELAQSFPVLTITGPRQAGKTTLRRMAILEPVVH